MKTPKEHLSFLSTNQPLPDDKTVTQDQLIALDDARKYFKDNPSIECIPLFLGCFGGSDGFGVYQMLDDVFFNFTLEQVLPYLLPNFTSANPHIRYWNLQIGSNYLDPKNLNLTLLQEIKKLADDPVEGIRETAKSYVQEFAQG